MRGDAAPVALQGGMPEDSCVPDMTDAKTLYVIQGPGVDVAETSVSPQAGKNLVDDMFS